MWDVGRNQSLVTSGGVDFPKLFSLFRLKLLDVGNLAQVRRNLDLQNAPILRENLRELLSHSSEVDFAGVFAHTLHVRHNSSLDCRLLPVRWALGSHG